MDYLTWLNLNSFPKRILRLITFMAVFSLLGCTPLTQVDSTPTLSPFENTETSLAQTVTAPFPTPTLQNTPSLPNKLILWLSPQFDPDAGTPASNLLKTRLENFSKSHSGIEIEVRIKAASGPGGLLDALTATSSAAPAALPDLIVLDHDNLEAGAVKGLLFPYGDSSTTSSSQDWFGFAHELSLVQGIVYGLPFAGDALGMVYRPDLVEILPTSWSSLIYQNNVVAFPAADPQSLTTLTLYESGGGQITDSQDRPILTADNLVQVLKIFTNGLQSNVFPTWLTTYDTYGQAWQAFKDSQATWVIAWVSQYLAEQPANTSILPFLPLDDTSESITLATGWSWALANPAPERRALSIELAEWLSESEFLSEWTSAAGYLPTRPSSLEGWADPNLRTLINQIALSAQLSPSNDLLLSLGPVLKEATLEVLKLENDPVQAAQAASEQLKGP